MPLIVMCGLPGSGKTYRVGQIAAYLRQKHGRKVCVVNEESLGIEKNAGYKSAEDEKMTRGRIKFQVEKNLVGDAVVVVDSLNYIKGYRYQMYCIAREQKTTYCVVYCNTVSERCKEFNLKNANRFSEELYIVNDFRQEELMKRMERPELKNRWDNPLIERREEEVTPVEEIADLLLFQEKKSKDPISTKQNYLIELDRIMQEINEEILVGKIKLENGWSAVELKKLKKNFVNIAREKPQNLKILKKGYLDFVVEADKRK